MLQSKLFLQVSLEYYSIYNPNLIPPIVLRMPQNLNVKVNCLSSRCEMTRNAVFKIVVEAILLELIQAAVFVATSKTVTVAKMKGPAMRGRRMYWCNLSMEDAVRCLK